MTIAFQLAVFGTSLWIALVFLIGIINSLIS